MLYIEACNVDCNVGDEFPYMLSCDVSIINILVLGPPFTQIIYGYEMWVQHAAFVADSKQKN